MEKWMRKTIELAAGLAFTGKYNPSVVPYYPQKTALPKEESRYFKRTYPERVGISSGRLLAMLVALEKEKRANIHNILVVKDSQVILECSHPGYSVNTWHLAHSMSKSVTAMAIGMLFDEGRLSLDDRLCDIFSEIRYADKRFENITVRHLLTMRTGVKFGEAGSVTETAWTRAYFESAMSFAPGDDFFYNSMNSYMLARIVHRLTGEGLVAFLKPRLFEPLGIDNYFWELGPEGTEKGGWGLFMSLESWARLGVMMLGKGVFEGRRILSEEWVNAATSKQSDTPPIIGNYNYGYQVWVSRDDDEFLFNGMLGQNVWVCPKNNLVVCLNGGNNELFQNSPALRIIETYLGRDLSDDLRESCFTGDLLDLRRKEESFFERRHWIRPYVPERHGIGQRLRLRAVQSYPEEWEELLGRYSFAKNNQSIIPLFIRGMQNNLRNTIDAFVFERVGEVMWFTAVEGGVEYRMEIGFTEPATTVLEYHGERYLVKVMGEAMEDEDRNMLYKLELIFPEMPNTRMIKMSMPEDGRLLVRMSEVPNDKIADLFFEEIGITNQRLAFFYELLEKRLGKNFVQKKLSETFSPVLMGARVGAVNYTEIMDGEREKIKASEKTVRIINTLIEKLIHDEDEMDEEDHGGLRSFLGEVVERIKAKLPKKPSNSDTGTAITASSEEAERIEDILTEE